MADTVTLTFKVLRDDELIHEEQLSAESVTIGKGPAAMLRIEDEGLADLQAVINLNDEDVFEVKLCGLFYLTMSSSQYQVQ